MNRNRSRRWPVVVGIAGLALPAAAQVRVVNYNVAALNGDQNHLRGVFAALNSDDRPGYAVAPHIYVFQEVQNSDRTPLLSHLNAVSPPGVTYVMGTYTNNNEDGVGGAQAICFRSDTIVEDPAGHIDIYTGGGRNTDRWKLSLVGYNAAATTFYVYGSHLKASQGAAEEQERLAGAVAIRNDADALPAGTHILYAGDWNVYSNTEPAYLEMTSAGSGQAIDPLGAGSWAGPGNAIKHTQAPCLSGCVLVGGGMDDRFDFQLGTAAFNDGEGLARIAGAYRSFGNDGQHYDNAINAGNNFYYPGDVARSNALADLLYDASDHVPVVCEYQVPAVLAVSEPTGVGRVIRGASVGVSLRVWNAAAVLVPYGADELDWQVTGSGALSGVQSGVRLPLSAPAEVVLAFDTTVVGNASGTATATTGSQAAANPTIVRNVSGTVLRPANASFAAGADVTALSVPLAVAADSGVQALAVEVFNRGYDGLQARLDIDAVNGAAEPLVFVGGLATNIEAGPATLQFAVDTAGLAAGLIEREATIVVSDEDLPGATARALTLHVTMTVSGARRPGDMDCDGLVNNFDIDPFVLAISDAATYALLYPGCAVLNGDIDGDGQVNNFDIDPFVALISGG